MIINNMRFIDACDSGDLELVKQFVAQGIDIKEETYAFIKASEKGQLYVVNYLIEQGIDYHIDNECIFKNAVMHQHVELLQWLVNQGTIDTTKLVNSRSTWYMTIYKAFAKTVPEYEKAELFGIVLGDYWSGGYLKLLKYFISTGVLDMEVCKNYGPEFYDSFNVCEGGAAKDTNEFVKQFGIKINYYE